MKNWWEDESIYVEDGADDELVSPTAYLQHRRRMLNDRLIDPEYKAVGVRHYGEEEMAKTMANIQEMVAYFDFVIEFIDSVNIEEWREIQ